MRIVAQFCHPGGGPYQDLAVRIVQGESNGDVETPADWPLSLSEVVSGFATGRDLVPAAPTPRRPLPDFLTEGEHKPGFATGRSVFAAVDRLTLRWTRWGWRLGLFDGADAARAFFDDLRWLIARRALAPDVVAWLGAAATPALRGFGVDSETGAVMPAHALPGFAPVAPSDDSDSGAERVLRQIREAVGRRADRPAQPAPSTVTLDPLRFLLPDGILDPAALAHAARLATFAAEIELATRVSATEGEARAAYSQRPIAIRLANLGAFVTGQGLAYDTAAGRALAASVAGLVTAAVAAASAELAVALGPCAALTSARRLVRARLVQAQEEWERAVALVGGVARPNHIEATASALSAAAGPLWQVAVVGQQWRHTRFTAVGASHLHRPLPLEVLSPGAGPLPGLTIDAELADGEFARVVHPSVLSGLAMLGLGISVQAAAVRRLRGHRSLAGAPGLSLEGLRARGLDQDALMRIEQTLGEATDLRHVLTRWIVGPETCARLADLDTAATDDYGFDLVSALGFTTDALEAANRHCFGEDSLIGVTGLADADAAALAPPADPENAEAAMIEAVGAVVSVAAMSVARHRSERTTVEPAEAATGARITAAHASS